jgi:hypothetical protein
VLGVAKATEARGTVRQLWELYQHSVRWDELAERTSAIIKFTARRFCT